MANTDRLHLHQNGKNWRVLIAVPRHLQGLLGKKALSHPLGTPDLGRANRLKAEHVARFMKLIDSAERQYRGAESLIEVAYRLRLEKTAEEPGGLLERFELVETVEEVRAAKGSAAAKTYEDVARGKLVPLSLFEEDWLATIGNEKTRHEACKAFREFQGFMAKRNRDSLSMVTAEDVEAWRDGLKVQTFGKDNAKPLSVGTINKRLSSLSSFMDYCKKRKTLAGPNPVSGTWIEKRVERKRRRFKLEEVQGLFAAGNRYQKDAMAVAMLGLRLNEQWALKASHFEREDGLLVMHVPGTKTEAADRRLVVPQVMLSLFARLIEEAPANGGHLFPAPAVAKLKARGYEPGRKLRRWIRKNGTGLETDWHSWRRFCAWLFERARQPENICARWLGHAGGEGGTGKLSMSYGLYSGEADLHQLKESIDAAMAVLPEDVRACFL